MIGVIRRTYNPPRPAGTGRSTVVLLLLVAAVGIDIHRTVAVSIGIDVGAACSGGVFNMVGTILRIVGGTGLELQQVHLAEAFVIAYLSIVSVSSIHTGVHQVTQAGEAVAVHVYGVADLITNVDGSTCIGVPIHLVVVIGGLCAGLTGSGSFVILIGRYERTAVGIVEWVSVAVGQGVNSRDAACRNTGFGQQFVAALVDKCQRIAAVLRLQLLHGGNNLHHVTVATCRCLSSRILVFAVYNGMGTEVECSFGCWCEFVGYGYDTCFVVLSGTFNVRSSVYSPYL